MNPSPLLLERYYFTKIELDTHMDGDPKVVNLLDCQMETGQAVNQPRRFQVILKLKLHAKDGENPAYTGHFHIAGYFRIAETWPDNQLQSLVEANGASVLYGAIREMLMTLTGRGPWPAVMLKSVSFYKPKLEEGAGAPSKLKEKQLPPARVRKAISPAKN